MTPLATLLLMGPALLLLSAVLLPSHFADRNARRVRRLVTCLVGGQCAASLLAAAWLLATPARDALVGQWPREAHFAITLNYDGVASLMLMLVSFVGLVVCQYSIRYLDGEATQGRYFRWVSVTLGSVSLLILAGNLLMFFVAWVMTSLSLHRLLLHYPERPAARRAAWTKFAVSRLGDAFLIGALILVFAEFRTFDFAELFAAAQAASAEQSSGALTWIGWLLILGAVTKSAQFPVHSWLPETMETPTPVSALMHAGIVNAGGYLVIRLSPLIVHAPSALTTLAFIGALTACFAGLVMLTQPSVKRALAYSTIAQMGFMMLQCGLGAFSAAMLHILAHSLYKAHAFLNSGSALSEPSAVGSNAGRPLRTGTQVGLFALATFLSTGVYLGTSTALGLAPTAKPGGFVLGLVLCLAFTGWLWNLLAAQKLRPILLGLATMAGLSVLYVAAYLGIDTVVSPSVPAVVVGSWITTPMLLIATAFASLFALQSLLTVGSKGAWREALYVHASNGFYIDVIVRRAFGSLASS